MTDRNRRFVAALFLAALYRKGLLQGAVALVKALAWRWRGRRANRWVYYRRMRACYACPLFYAPLRTCGSPLLTSNPELGCYCAMERKAALPDARCWAWDNLDLKEIGWPWPSCLNENS